MDTRSHCPVSQSSLAEPLILGGSPSVRPLSIPSDPSSGATSHIDQGESPRQAPTVITLPDDVLLGIFDFCRDDHPDFRPVWDWHLLVHVCRRWRQIIYASPHRLNLKILCTHRTPVRKHLDIWPAFPIVIDYRKVITPNDEDNIVTALDSKHLDRVCFVGLRVTGSQLRKIAPVMREPFPVLNHLQISLRDESAQVLPGGFLGGSAPCLQRIKFESVPYLALPTLLLSASGLVQLWLHIIPPAGYISPEEMVASLAGLPKLEHLYIFFQTYPPFPNRIRPPPITRIVLPALASFLFRGVNEYLEDLVSRIDGPQLTEITIFFLNQFVNFPVQLIEFIGRSVGPRSTLFKRVHVNLDFYMVIFDLHPHENPRPRWDRDRGDGKTTITCNILSDGRNVSHMVWLFNQVYATLSHVVYLELETLSQKDTQLRGMGDDEWLHFLHQFSTVQMLKVCSSLASCMARRLEDITEERVAGLFPSLQLICLQDQPESSIEKLVALRRLSGRPITVVNSGTEFDKRIESYIK